ncbi:ABC transporter substrate-binding protein [Nocardioides sp. LHG3406-4]|uniref:ABC transporter substrate-binding protein n=1 Tax=Nocardioides sp. LHG3406-4 TaxID=2804575 RepID=UPI003CED4A1E
MHRRRPIRLAAVGLVVCLVPALVACQGGEKDDPPSPESSQSSPTSTPSPETGPVTLGVFGREEELNAFESIVRDYNTTSQTGQVELEQWADKGAALQGIEDGDPPDVFMISRRDLPGLLARNALRPVDELLDERGVDFGDGFARGAVQSFGVDARLQCMAYSVSPEVMYINTDLVDFDKMARRGLNVPNPDRQEFWSLAEFTAAAEFASRPARGTRGFYVEPTVRGLAPYIYSGGGHVFDDEDDPKSLAFSDGDTRDALERSLAVLRDAQLTLTDGQLKKASPQEWFERGKLGILAGQRDLVPGLRAVPGLNFDAISMPVLDSAATVGDITGLCISADAPDPQAAADVIADLISDEAVQKVVSAGFMVPANSTVAGSDAFLQPTRAPATSTVFNASIRGMVIPPLVGTGHRLEMAESDLIEQLLRSPGELDLEAVTEQIDEVSRPILDPDYVPESESPGSTEGSSESPSSTESSGSD